MKLQFRVYNAAKTRIFSCSFKIKIQRPIVKLFKILVTYAGNI